MRKEIIFPIIIAVVLGAIFGYSFGYLSLQPQIASLNSSLSSLQTQTESLEAQTERLQEADISASLRDDKLESYENHEVKGTIINFGNETALNIVITVHWYNEGASFHQETITLPRLEGRSIKVIDFDYSFEGQADDFDYTITWN
ncbi:MAG: hypothetical protein JSV20_10535 [Candidatus Bathyarchaeota archaeon]|nr:MAG: hypothetical protein JSV20_10535 [Candidatus Bathyarchaeota archaeon]